jgi:hypothetical protein
MFKSEEQRILNNRHDEGDNTIDPEADLQSFGEPWAGLGMSIDIGAVQNKSDRNPVGAVEEAFYGMMERCQKLVGYQDKTRYHQYVEQKEKDKIDNKDYLPNPSQSLEAVWCVGQDNGEAPGTHGTGEPKPAVCLDQERRHEGFFSLTM